MINLLGIAGSSRKDGNTEFTMKEALKAAEQEGAENRACALGSL
jgi:multimeric flavodoxin WrbA